MTEIKWDKAQQERDELKYTGETSKAHNRRVREGWFEKYAPADQTGIDIGCQKDALNQTFRRFDFVYGDGDATYMEGVPNDSFHTVYASHILEHLSHPEIAVKRWYEITKPGGHLIICVPHRNLYERKRFVPSNWNPEHTYFWLPEEEDRPCTRNFKKTICDAIPNVNIVSFRVLDEGYDYTIAANEHALGEYAIEAIIKK